MGNKKGILLEGGTYSSKTYSALQALIIIAQETPRNLDINILSESVPHLKGGCIKDFFNILGEIPENNSCYNITDRVYRQPDWKGTLSFLSADNEKALGMRRDVLFINEGDTLTWEVAKELISRTNIFVIIDWNPRSEFWAHEYYKDDPKWAYDHSTYLDALDVIPAGKRDDIEDLGRKDPNYHTIYELGLLGKIEGLVYPHFEQVDKLPLGEFFYGLDYGFSADPTVLVKNVILGDKLYSQEILYDRTGLTNDQIARKLSLAGVMNEPIYPDPNEPKSAEELRNFGFNVIEAVKGKGSVEYGIQKVNQYYQHWTKDSLNCIKEQKNFSYIRDKLTGEFTDKTTHTWSHCLVAGTLITTRKGQIPIELVTTNDEVLTRQGWHKVKASGMTIPSTEVRTITFSNGQSITGTPDHRIFIKGKGFTPLNSCRYGDIIEPCKEKQSPTQEFNITDTQIPQTGQIGTTLRGTETVNAPFYIKRFGKIPMAQSPKVAKSITKIAILLITALKILRHCLFTNTKLADTIEKENSGWNTIRRWLKHLKCGILPQKVLSGIELTLKGLFSIPPQLLRFVPSVEGNLLTLAHYHKIDFAQTPVNQNGVGIQALTTKPAFAHIADRNIQSINTPKHKPAPVYVLSVSGVHKKKQPTFDLTIDSIPEFYANGILVHNSMDSRRYAVATHKLSGISGKMPVWRF